MTEANPALAEEQKGKRKALLETLPPSESSGRGSSSEKRGRPKGSKNKRREDIDPEHLKMIRDCFRKLVSTVRKLRDKDATREDKLSLTTDYVIDSAELVLVKHAAMLVDYAEEVNLAAACGLWGGYRLYVRFDEKKKATVDGASELIRKAGPLLDMFGLKPAEEEIKVEENPDGGR